MEGLDILGDGRDRKDMLQKCAQRLSGAAAAWQNVLIENGEAQPGLKERIKGLKPVRTPVAILGSLGVCIYVPASRHWLISYSPIHLI